MKGTSKLILWIVGGVILNIYFSNFDTLWDLTADKRYTLNEDARSFIKSVPEGTIITVLLEGDVPASFKNYRGFIDYYLREVRNINPGIDILYKDPTEGTPEEISSFRTYLASYGVSPISRRVAKDQSVNESLIYPFVSIHNQRRVVFVDLLDAKKKEQTEEEAILNSQIAFEPKLLTALRDISSDTQGLVGIVGNSNNLIARSFNQERGQLGNYFFFPMSSDDLFTQIDTLDAVIVVVRETDLSRNELLAIDQCLLRGVPVIWFVDKFAASVDSIGIYGQYLAQAREYNVEDMLFKHGVRLSTSLLQDLECSPIPQVTGTEGGQPQTTFIPFPYHLLAGVNTDILGEISDEVHLKFATPVEVLNTQKLEIKSILNSSHYTKLIPSPAFLNFEFLRFEPDMATYKEGVKSLGVLVQGAFSSYFSNRLSPEDLSYMAKFNHSVLSETSTAKEVIVSDVDIILPHRANDGSYYPLAFNFWDRQVYNGNKLFIKAILESIINDGQMLKFRKKELKTSTIDQTKFESKKIKYFVYLLLLPMVLAVALLSGTRWYRKMRYGNSA